MKAGNLPDRHPERMWGGPGIGAPCAVCGKIIGTEELEFELQFTSDDEPGVATFHVHATCFTDWELERRSRGSDGEALRERGNAGIIRDRERNPTSQGERG
jgi:hypothetical protein